MPGRRRWPSTTSTVAQVLLTLDDTENRRRWLNARNTMETLLRLGAVPVINENDTVATQEIRFGDNDRLAARVAQMIAADTLVLFSDIDGLYTADPRKNPGARFIPEVREITAEIEATAGDPGSGIGSGGMVTKLQAARIALAAGCRMAVAPGAAAASPARHRRGRPLHLVPAQPRAADRPQAVDRGRGQAPGHAAGRCRRAPRAGQGRQPLAGGRHAVEGEFQKGDAVVVKDPEGHAVARGLAAYSAEDARRIIGRKSGDFESLLGYRGRDEIIHRDDLVLEP